MRASRWVVPLAAAAAYLVAMAAGVASAGAVRETLPLSVVRQDFNPGPCVAVVELQCFCAEPRLFIDGVAVPFSAPLSAELYTNVTTELRPNSSLTFTALVGKDDSSTLGWALRVNISGRSDMTVGTPDTDGIFWEAALVTEEYAATLTAAATPVPSPPAGGGETPPPSTLPPGLRFPWATAQLLADDAAGNFTAWILPQDSFLREVRPSDVALPYWIAARAPGFPDDLCVGGIAPGDPTPLPSSPTPRLPPTVPPNEDEAAVSSVDPINDAATMTLVNCLWGLLAAIGLVTLVATWVNTARLWAMQLEETTYAPGFRGPDGVRGVVGVSGVRGAGVGGVGAGFWNERVRDLRAERERLVVERRALTDRAALAAWARRVGIGREEDAFGDGGDGSGDGGVGVDRRLAPLARGGGEGSNARTDDLLQDGVNGPVAVALATRATLAHEAATPWGEWKQ